MQVRGRDKGCVNLWGALDREGAPICMPCVAVFFRCPCPRVNFEKCLCPICPALCHIVRPRGRVSILNLRNGCIAVSISGVYTHLSNLETKFKQIKEKRLDLYQCTNKPLLP